MNLVRDVADAVSIVSAIDHSSLAATCYNPESKSSRVKIRLPVLFDRS